MPAKELPTQLALDLGRFASDPLGFAHYAFPWLEPGSLDTAEGPRTWQAVILNLLGEHLRSPMQFEPLQLAVSSGHGIGKSALIAMICNWAMSTCDDCRIVVTANTEVQLATKTWPEISKWFRLAVNAHWWNVGATTITVKEKDHERSWRVDRITWSENNTEAFAGLHNQGKRIVVIFDESSTIADKIWEVTEGALTDEGTEIIWLAFGNPTQNTGRFRECFGRFKHRWVTRQIDSRTVPGTNKALFDKWIADWGEDSDFVRIRVRGEFPRAGSNQFISGELVSLARKRRVSDQTAAFKVISVDVARFGDDQTVIGYRQGLKAVILEKLRGLDTTQVAMRVMMHCEREKPRGLVIDGDGIGGAVADYLKLHFDHYLRSHLDTFRVVEFHGMGTPTDPEAYFNRRAEIWGLMRYWLETAEIPDDPELETDLTGPQYFFSSKNQIQLERKDDMKERGLASPDCGDMLAMTFAIYPPRWTRDEQKAELIAKVEARSPVAAHFMRLENTLRRDKAKEGKPYWQ